ncbi:MAG: energy-coupling factor transporter ATPase [Acetobacter sp.]|nr:energy-coupling factor transporter ATPase [Bacteroides sp.]MCM1341081.1 energy-coupling factor transporter ATPase [Acetobacter sp.]MCM1433586.1 energy-coupling factor transporter ATPase [Clostridiales bacterium]
MEYITAKNLIHSYAFAGSKNHSLDCISFTIEKGEFVTILGRNGCGKTTLARHLNALLPLQNGELTVAGINAEDKNNVWAIRSKCGMVFQNPDNQFISSLIEEDLAFGPRNFGIEENEIQVRIEDALEAVGMSGYEKHSPHLLSGGQKQRIAIAGVLAVKPDIIILDEVTSMLDTKGREEVLSTIRKLHKNGHTIIMISHYIEEAVYSDKVIIMNNGKITAQGETRSILTNIDLLNSAGLIAPITVRIYYDLMKKGIKLPYCPLNDEELAGELCQSN